MANHTTDGLQRLYLDKLAESGINPRTAQRLGIRLMKCCEHLPQFPNYHQQGAIVLPYFDFDGHPLPDNYARLRYLTPPNGFHKFHKYEQPAHSANHLYLDPTFTMATKNGKLGWKEIIQDAQWPIIVTEGEFKVIALSQAKFPALGIGGVNSWKTRNPQNQSIPLPEFLQINFEDRTVYIIFDDDTQSNPNVWRAQEELSNFLVTRGARMYGVRLPSVFKDRKTGVDDFLVKRGVDALCDLINVNKEPNPALVDFECESMLLRLNGQIAWVSNIGCYIRFSDGKYCSKFEMQNEYSSVFYEYNKIDGRNGKIKVVRRPAFDWWREHPYHNALNAVKYLPGLPECPKLPECPTLKIWNTWKPSEVQPVEGDVTEWLRLLSFLSSGSEEVDAELVNRLCWIARYPGRLLRSSTILVGAVGVGKSMLGEILNELVGKHNMLRLTAQNFGARFNAGLERCVIGWVDEYGELNVQDNMIRTSLKSLITSDVIVIERKGHDSTNEDNHMNIIACTNRVDLIRLESDDRRTFIVDIAMPMEQAQRNHFEFIKIREHCMNNLGAILYWLLNRKMPKDYDPSNFMLIPCITRDSIMGRGVTPVLRLLKEFADNPEGLYCTEGAAYARRPGIFSCKKLQQWFEMYDHKLATNSSISTQALGVAMADPALKGRFYRINVENGKHQGIKIGHEVIQLFTWIPEMAKLNRDEARKWWLEVFPPTSHKF